MKIPATFTPTSVNLYLDGAMRTFPKSHQNFDLIRRLVAEINELATRPSGLLEWMRLSSPEQKVERRLARLRVLMDVKTYIESFSEGRVKVIDGDVYFEGEPLDNAMTQRIQTMIAEGHDVRALARFLDRIMANPRTDIREEIFLWMDAAQMPITETGKVTAYKKVANDYSSIHKNPDGSAVMNRPGDTPEMKREDCDENRHNTCSRGLHFCAYSYLSKYGLGGENRIVILEIDPADIVSIPTDYDHAKGRACKYYVAGEVPQEQAAEFFQTSVVRGSDVDPDDPFAEAARDYDWDTDWDLDEDYDVDDDHWNDKPDTPDFDSVVEDRDDLVDRIAIGQYNFAEGRQIAVKLGWDVNNLAVDVAVARHRIHKNS